MTKKSNQQTLKIGVATTVKAAMAKTRLPIGVIKAAQAAGSKAFKANGRIDCDMLLDDVAQLPTMATTQGVDYFVEKALSMRADRMLKEQKLAERAKLLVPVEDVRRVWRNITIAAKIKMDSSASELSAQAGMRLNLTSDQTAVLRELHAKMMRRVQSELYTQQWGPINCPLCKGDLNNEK